MEDAIRALVELVDGDGRYPDGAVQMMRDYSIDAVDKILEDRISWILNQHGVGDVEELIEIMDSDNDLFNE